MTILQIILIIAISAIFIILLTFIEKKLSKRLKHQEKDRNAVYLRKINLLKKSNKNPRERLSKLNKLSKSFFKAAFDLEEHLSSSELINEFNEKGKKRCADYCKKVLRLNFAQRLFKQKEVNALLDNLKEIVEKNKIFPKSKKKIENHNNEKQKEIKIKNKEISKDDWKELKENLHHSRNKTEKYLAKIFSDNKILDLAYTKTKGKTRSKKLKILSKKDSKSYNKAMKMFKEQEDIQNKTEKFVKKLYFKLEKKEDKERLKELIENWKKDYNKKVKKMKNPFKKHINILILLKEYIIELEENYDIS